jgi:hypothetical protein
LVEDQPLLADHGAVVRTEATSECRALPQRTEDHAFTCTQEQRVTMSWSSIYTHLLALPHHQKSPFPAHHPSKLAIANRGKPIQYSKLDISQSKRLDFSIHPSASPLSTRKERDSSIVSVENLMPWQTSPVSNEVEKIPPFAVQMQHTHTQDLKPPRRSPQNRIEDRLCETPRAPRCADAEKPTELPPAKPEQEKSNKKQITKK